MKKSNCRQKPEYVKYVILKTIFNLIYTLIKSNKKGGQVTDIVYQILNVKHGVRQGVL